MHHPKNPVLRFHGWDEPVPQGSVYLVSSFFFFFSFPSWPFFFSSDFFFWGAHCFSSWAHFGFFFPRNPNYHFFLGGTPTYPSNLPTTFPPTSPSTSLILLTPLFCLCSPPSPALEIQWDQGLELQSFKKVRRNKGKSLEHQCGRSLEQA